MQEMDKKILIINELLLPNELLDIIKSYVFYNKKKWFHSFISKNIYYDPPCEIPEYPLCPYPIICIYDIGTDMKWNICLSYCETCGKYVRRERLITFVNENLHCNC
jgi:hypothetical protein